MATEGASLWQKLLRRDTWVIVAQNFVMDWSMLWKDLLLGFLIAGALSVFVPDGVWQALFVKGASPWVQVPANALLGPLVAVLSFVCSIGNVPMAAVLWGAGVSFGGVLAFLYADLIVLPLLDVYRRYYGLGMAAYIGAVFYATMVAAALVMDVAFNALGWIPRHPAEHACRDGPFFAELHILAQPRLWPAGRGAVRDGAQASDAARALRTPRACAPPFGGTPWTLVPRVA